jgi:LytR cell envelope-related transcriptional attenuator
MHLIREIGAYAGFAAVVGLAVLSALYFSQARDVRRLREWAGRAPERAVQQGVVAPAPSTQAPPPARPGATQPPIPARPGATQPPAPARPPGMPAPAARPAAAPIPVAAGAGSALAGSAAAPPAVPDTGSRPATGTQPATGTGPATIPPVSRPVTGAPPGTTPPRPGPPPGTRPGLDRAGGTQPPTHPSRTLPPRGPILPSASQVRRGPWYRRVGPPAPRYIVLIVVGVLVVGGGAAYGVSQLASGGGSDQGSGGDDAAATRTPAINPSATTISVLNGTTVPGLAAQIADKLEQQGFQRGNVANATDQERAESAVLYASGAAREARFVARKLHMSQIEPVDPRSQALAGNASVIVIVGADQTQ